MKSTDIVAWWGAIIASLVLLWDVYKWKTQGPRLVMRLSPNMLVSGDPPREGKTWVSVTVSNVGDRPTTIKLVGMQYYTNWFRRLTNRADNNVVYLNPSDSHPLPRVLNSGDEWVGLIPQERLDKGVDLAEMSRTGHLIICLFQSHKRRALRTRLTIPAEKKRDS